MGCIYRHPNTGLDHFNEAYSKYIQKLNKNATCIIGGDFNIDLLQFERNNINEFLATNLENYLTHHSDRFVWINECPPNINSSPFFILIVPCIGLVPSPLFTPLLSGFSWFTTLIRIWFSSLSSCYGFSLDSRLQSIRK